MQTANFYKLLTVNFMKRSDHKFLRLKNINNENLPESNSSNLAHNLVKQNHHQMPSFLKQNPMDIKHNKSNIQLLTLQYKLSLEFTPSLGIYLLPSIEDYFIWEVYIFLREGYYKDSKLHANIYFSKNNAKLIQKIIFVSPVFHPLVNWSSGELDLKFLDCKQNLNNEYSSIVECLISLKQIFGNENYLKIKESLNPEASKIYLKSQIMFIQKIFETTVLPSETKNFGFIENQAYDEQDQQNNSEVAQFQFFVNKIKQICPNSQLRKTDIEQINQSEKQEKIDQKVTRYFDILMSL